MTIANLGPVPQPPEVIPRLLFPSWMDPNYVLRASFLTPPTDLTGAVNAKVPIPADPDRWAILIQNKGTAGANLSVGIIEDCQNWPFSSVAVGGALFLPLAIYGPIVTGPFWVASAMTVAARWWGIKRS